MSLLYIEKVQSRVRSYVEFDRFDDVIRESGNATDCMDCEAFLEAGIDTFNCIKKTDMTLRELVLSGRLDDKQGGDFERALEDVLRDWVKPVPDAEAWIKRCQDNGYDVANLDEFRQCVAEAYSILNFDPAAVAPESILGLQHEAIEEHRRGETAEFFSGEE